MVCPQGEVTRRASTKLCFLAVALTPVDVAELLADGADPATAVRSATFQPAAHSDLQQTQTTGHLTTAASTSSCFETT